MFFTIKFNKQKHSKSLHVYSWLAWHLARRISSWASRLPPRWRWQLFRRLGLPQCFSFLTWARTLMSPKAPSDHVFSSSVSSLSVFSTRWLAVLKYAPITSTFSLCFWISIISLQRADWASSLPLACTNFVMVSPSSVVTNSGLNGRLGRFAVWAFRLQLLLFVDYRR